jgi:heme oxygenase
MMKGDASPLLTVLRGASGAQHARLEAGLDILRPALDPEWYRRLLAVFHGYYCPLEAAVGRIDGWSAVGLDPGPRRKSPLLRADLVALGMTTRAITRLPRCRELPVVRSLPAVLGCLYVTEGATLGGRLILPHVCAVLGVAPGAGASFFHGYGAATNTLWSSFTDALAALPVDAAVERTVVESAVATFATLERWLGEQGVLR